MAILYRQLASVPQQINLQTQAQSPESEHDMSHFLKFQCHFLDKNISWIRINIQGYLMSPGSCFVASVPATETIIIDEIDNR